MAYDAYLWIKDAPGESESKVTAPSGASATPIEMKSYDLGMTMAASPSRSDSGSASTGRVKFNEFGCEKNIDWASCKLAQMCATGKHIDLIIVQLYRSQGDSADSKVKYVELEYKNCVITEASIKASGGDDLPSETLKFNYGSVKFTYQYTNHETGAIEGAPSTFGWSQIANKALV